MLKLCFLVASLMAYAGGGAPSSQRSSPGVGDVVALVRSPTVQAYAEASVQFDRRSVIRTPEVEAPSEFASILEAGANGVESLISLLEDPNRSIRVAALLALEKITFVRTSDTYTFWVPGREPTPERSKEITEWRAWWKSNAHRSRTEWVIDALAASNPGTRGLAASELAAIGEDQAVEPLRRLLLDAVPYVREEAALALGSLGDYCAVPSIVVNSLESGQSALAARGLQVLGKLAGQSTQPAHVATEEERATQVKKWNAWWKETGVYLATQRGCPVSQ